MFDAREATYTALQRKSSEDGTIPLQSLTKQDWWLIIGIECIKEDCDNVLTPEGVKLLSEIDRIVEEDPLWPSLCLKEVGEDKCANDISIGGKIAKASALTVFRTAYGNDLSELTQYAIDLALFISSFWSGIQTRDL